MKIVVVIFFLVVAPLVYGQTLPSHDEIFGSLYGNHYDPTTKLTIWHCPQDGASAPDACMFVGNSTSRINLLQMTLMEIDGSWKAFVAASTTGRLPNCHACQPSIAVGVLILKANRWQLESKNDEAFRFGAWAKPADLELVKVGPKLYGFMFTVHNGGQGYFLTYARLLLPDGKNIHEVWHDVLDEDNKGDYDPTGKYGSPQRIHVDAAYRFLMDNNQDHYNLQVISRGYGYGEGEAYGSRNAILNYCFLNGQYRQINKGLQCPRK